MKVISGQLQRQGMTSKINSYRDLQVWQRSMELAYMVYSLVKLLPKEEIYARIVKALEHNEHEWHERTGIEFKGERYE